ncbi:lipoprotein [soil metagenome]|jgi:predicted lipoprotein with Yx(FWY)xxD motif
MATKILLSGCALVLALAACAGDPAAEGEPAGAVGTATDVAPAATEDTPGAVATTETTGAPTDAGTDTAAAATVEVADTSLGSVLADADGRTLYVFDNDTDGESSCYDDCATNWPPLVTQGDPAAGEGADGGLLGTTERTDGTTQVTYGGLPLYYFAADQAAGDVNGQAVGEVWWVVSPEGEPITGTASDTASESGAADY